MTNVERMTNVEKVPAARGRHSGFVIDSSSIIRLPHRSPAKVGHSLFSAAGAFTLIELIVVVTIITILAGLVLSTAGYARKKGARARAETEIAAMSAACENYKADNAIYPKEASSTDMLDAKVSGNPSAYQSASLYLYKQLSGDSAANRTPTGKGYMQFKPNMLYPPDQSQTVLYIQDPFGNSYGYSTANQVNSAQGYNPTFDLWSTAGLTATPGGIPDTITPQWIKNW
jgi:prepilin-type N-terminal cleavage/methylation domain-containing protein